MSARPTVVGARALALAERTEGAPAERVLLLLPGYGDDAGWFVPHVESLDPGHRWHVAAATPPLHGADGPMWFATGEAGPDLGQLRAAVAAVVVTAADLLATHHLPPEALVLAGFSQGGAVALATLLDPDAHPRPAAVAALGAFLPSPEGIDPGLGDGRPVLVVHGTDDEAVDPLLGRSAAKVLTGGGADVTWSEVAGGHELSAPMAASVRAWLDAVADRRHPSSPLG